MERSSTPGKGHILSKGRLEPDRASQTPSTAMDSGGAKFCKQSRTKFILALGIAGVVASLLVCSCTAQLWFRGPSSSTFLRQRDRERGITSRAPTAYEWVESHKTAAGTAHPDGWTWKDAGGEHGLSASWRDAVSLPSASGGSASIRGEACLTKEKREEVRQVLDRRRRTPSDRKVAACVRTKDFGRFLPEWIAYHYAVGVDEMTVYDDDSVDGTREILQPFIDAGIVRYYREKIESRRNQMKPLNSCLGHYQMLRSEDRNAPGWLLFHDTDEYILPPSTSQSLSEALAEHEDICCLLVQRVQYGSGGYQETPRGLTLENFLTHASENWGKANRLPKVVINLDPSSPELGLVKLPLPSMHGVKAGSCTCAKVDVAKLRINHYLGSLGDFMDKTRRYWQENHSVDKVQEHMRDRDVNFKMTDAITHWACATREILARASEGSNLAA